MIKKLLLSTAVGTIAYYIVGWFVFEFVLGNYTEINTTQLVGFKKSAEQFSLGLLIVSCAAYAALLSFILIYLLDVKQLVKAFAISAVIGVLVAIMTDSYWFATSNFYSTATVVFFDVTAAGLTVGTMGLVIALLNKKIA